MFSKNYTILCCFFGTCWTTMVLSTETASGCQQSTLDLLFVLDGSGSVYGHFDEVKDFVKNVSRLLFNHKNQARIDIGVVQYSHFYPGRDWKYQKYMTTEIRIGEFRSFENFSTAVDDIELHNYTTYTGRAMEKAANEFATSPRFKETSHKQVMVLVTDGKSTDPDNVRKNANILRYMGVITYAVGVGDTEERELKLIASGNKNSTDRVYSIESFVELNSLVDSLQTEILSIDCNELGTGTESPTEVASSTVPMTTGSFSKSTSPPKTMPSDPCLDGTYPIGKIFLYEDGCCPFYYKCAQGAVARRPCAQGMFFDVTKGRCNFERDTPSCQVPRKPCFKRIRPTKRARY